MGSGHDHSNQRRSKPTREGFLKRACAKTAAASPSLFTSSDIRASPISSPLSSVSPVSASSVSSAPCTTSPGSASTAPSIYDTVSSCTIPAIDKNSSHFHIKVILKGKNRSARVPAMIDSGATALFISHKFVQKNNVRLQPLAHAIKLSNIDGTQNKAGVGPTSESSAVSFPVRSIQKCK